MNSKLDIFEQKIENNIDSFVPINKNKKILIESIINKANGKKALA